MRNVLFVLGCITAAGALVHSLFKSGEGKHNRQRGEYDVVRLRLSYEDLMNLVEPEEMAKKPPVPADLDMDSLPKYFCGCPNCGKMSLYGENQWRYQELSRTRGPYNNTTTYLTQCRNCNQFMKSTVDHDE